MTKEIRRSIFESLPQRVITCITPVLLLAGHVFGQTDTVRNMAPRNKSLKDLLDMKVTSASKTLQKLELAPATVFVITKEQIKSRGYQSLLDVMYDLPAVKVDDKIYSGIRNSFTVRGTQGSEKLVILLDGIVISSPSGEAMPIMENYPVNLAEQIEIVYGPASALYGANAVSGVINIITRKIPSRKGMNIEASSVGGNYGYTNSSLLYTQKLSENTNITVSGQYAYDKGVDYSKLYKNDSSLNVGSYSSGVLNSIYGPMAPLKPIRPKYEAPMEAYNIYAAIHSNDLVFSFFRNFTKIPSAFGSNTSNAIYNKDAFIAQNTTTGNISYTKSFDKITSTTSFTASEYNLSPQSNYRNLFTAMETGYKYSTCLMLKGEQQVDYKVSEKLNLTAGATLATYSATPQSADLDEPVNTNDFIHSSYLGTDAYNRPTGLPAQFYFIKYRNISSYLQMQYSPAEKIHFTIGGRFDKNSLYGYTFNPRMGLVYKPSEKTVLKLLYGSAYLAPSPSDSYAQYGSFYTPDSGRTYHSYFLHLPNPGLKPIQSKNLEMSVQQYLTDNLSFTMDGYYTVLTGLHAFADDSKTTKLYNNNFNGIPVDYVEVFVNEGRQINWGGTIRLNWKHAINNIQLNSYASLSYISGEVDNPATAVGDNDGDKQLDFISPFMMRIGTDLKAGKFTCSPRLLLIGRQHLSGMRDTVGFLARRQTISGYALLNISLRYNITKHASFFANVSNALNRRYRSVGFNMDLSRDSDAFHGQPEDPIRIAGGFNFSF